MSEIFEENPKLAIKIATSFLKKYNTFHDESYHFYSWDKYHKSEWDFLSKNKLEIELKTQIVEAPETHDPSTLKELRDFREGKINSVGVISEHEDLRIEAAVGRKALLGGKLVSQPDIILLVIFRDLPYRLGQIEVMKSRLVQKGLITGFKEIWIINEDGTCDQLESNFLKD